jgi:phosphatidylinositol alpha-1,6-mannosyltransferase
MAEEIGADFIVLDPAVPLGIVGPSLKLPYMVVLHGSDVTVPGRLPGSKHVLSRVLRGAQHIIAAGGYPAAEARQAGGENLPITVVPPGVDTQRFAPITNEQREATRLKFGLEDDAELIVGVSRLVPRKGFDTLIRAAAALAPSRPKLRVVIGGKGRDTDRLQKLIEQTRAPVTLAGRVSNEDLPLLYASADLSAMLCRTRWGGLEQEGFGIVFSEAAACGVPQIAGQSGGSAEAVVDGVTGLVIDEPSNVAKVARAIDSLLGDKARLETMGVASRQRALAEFDYDVLTARLAAVLGVNA